MSSNEDAASDEVHLTTMIDRRDKKRWQMERQMYEFINNAQTRIEQNVSDAAWF